jgi:hypothetical protein
MHGPELLPGAQLTISSVARTKLARMRSAVCSVSLPLALGVGAGSGQVLDSLDKDDPDIKGCMSDEMRATSDIFPACVQPTSAEGYMILEKAHPRCKI